MNSLEPIRALSTSAIGKAGLDDLLSARERHEQARILAGLIHAVFIDYYQRSREIPYRAKAAFERRDWPAVTQLSHDRLSIYSLSIDTLGPLLKGACPELVTDEALWAEAEAEYLSQIKGRYEGDLAFAFLQSVRRKIYQDEWRAVGYVPGPSNARAAVKDPIQITFEASIPLSSDQIDRIFDVPAMSVPWRNRREDAALAAAALNRAIEARAPGARGDLRIVVINAGFYRNRGAYIVGRVHIPGFGIMPLLIALLHEKDGLFADAVLTNSDELQFVFSSTLANFHVTCPHYHELAQFLFTLMPKRPLGIHYSTIGFNHAGKVAVMNEITREHARTGERLDTAVGFRGTVAIGFSMPSSKYVMKVIRDKPTEGYKWGTFAGVPAVIEKYRLVHDIDRAGSMLDNVIYYNVKLDASMFAPALLDELIEFVGGSVSRQGDGVVFKHLITQMKLIPLPIYLANASPEDAREAVVNLGLCIKNNAAANVFNRDLDGRNYGVSPIRKVYLFDYDAVEPLTGVKIRTNTTREDGEEDIPDWFFETGTVFLPEEMMVGLRIEDRELRRVFKETHPELMTVDYWEGMQRAMLEGKVPKVRSYPEYLRLRPRTAG